MALIQCPECGRQVSTLAAQCPGCGHPISAPPAQNASQVWSKALLALGAWLVTPWIARLIVALAALVVAYFLFRGH